MNGEMGKSKVSQMKMDWIIKLHFSVLFDIFYQFCYYQRITSLPCNPIYITLYKILQQLTYFSTKQYEIEASKPK